MIGKQQRNWRMAFGVGLVFWMAACGAPDEQTPAAPAEPVAARESAPETMPPPAPPPSAAPQYVKLTTANAAEILAQWAKDHRERRIVMETKWGEVEIQLFDDTPIHTGNLLYKIDRGYYERTEITRIAPEFVVQGGSTEEEAVEFQRFLIGKHSMPAEFHDHHVHTRGAVSMSRTYGDNPEKESVGYDFFVVLGRKIGAVELSQNAKRRSVAYTEGQARAYRERGGAPHLDGEHTVFGRVLSGMAALDAMAEEPTDDSDWPLRRVEVRLRTNPTIPQ